MIYQTQNEDKCGDKYFINMYIEAWKYYYWWNFEPFISQFVHKDIVSQEW